MHALEGRQPAYNDAFSMTIKTEPTEPQRSCEVVVVFWADELLRKDVTHGEAREGRHSLHQERLGGQGLVVRCPYSSHVPALWVERGYVRRPSLERMEQKKDCWLLDPTKKKGSDEKNGFQRGVAIRGHIFNPYMRACACGTHTAMRMHAAFGPGSMRYRSQFIRSSGNIDVLHVLRVRASRVSALTKRMAVVASGPLSVSVQQYEYDV